MSILDKASLIQIPSGYKSTKLYSLRPSNGDGDFNFSRSSSATRVNSEGLIETAKVLGTTEEVTNGDFSSGSSWYGSASISGGQLTKTSGGLAYQDSVVTANKYYKVVVDVASLDGATTLYFGGNQYTLSVGVQTIEAVGGTGNTFVGFNNGYSSGSGSVFNSISVIEYIENDVPRLDYSDGSCASLLLEGQSTNLITYSESLSNTNRSGTFVDNSAISPDGTQNATKITATSTDPFFYQSVTLNAATYTASLWVKGIGDSIGKEFRFAISNQTHISNKYTIPSEWTRFEFTASVSAGSVTTGVEIPDPAVSGDEVLAWGWQLEESSFATSYIPSNSGSSTTRTDESFVADTLSTVIGQTEGCIFIDFVYYEGNRFEIFDAANTSCLLRSWLFPSPLIA